MAALLSLIFTVCRAQFQVLRSRLGIESWKLPPRAFESWQLQLQKGTSDGGEVLSTPQRCCPVEGKVLRQAAREDLLEDVGCPSEWRRSRR